MKVQLVPDLVITIKMNTKTGAVQISANRMISAVEIMSICCGIAKTNADALLTQQNLLVKPPADSQVTSSEKTVADNPPHNFIPDPNNPDICNYCSLNRENHKSLVDGLGNHHPVIVS